LNERMHNVTRSTDMLKALFFDRHGYCMLVKRLSRGRFRVRVAEQSSGHIEMTSQELALLLSELSFVRGPANVP
jgi:hypothetical protein